MEFAKAELIGTVLVVLVTYNIVFSMIVKALGYIKDNTKTKLDNQLWGILSKSLEKVKEGLDYLTGNVKH